MLLAEACARVKRAHPAVATLVEADHSEFADELRARVTEAALEGEPRLRALAAALGPREVRRLVPGLRDWQDLRSAVIVLLRERARPTLVPSVWALWQTAPEVAEIRTILAEFGERFSWGEAVTRDYEQYAPNWVSSAAPGEEIRGWLDARVLSVSDMPKLAGRPFRPDTPLERLVREAVLTDGTVSQYRADGKESIARWRGELSPQKAVRFGRNYLTTMPESEWYRPILNWMETTYGLPRKPKLAAFWDPVPEPIRLAFQRIFVRERIQDLFRGDRTRRDYWLTWIDDMTDVFRCEAAGVEYGILDFGSFGIVEFFEVGNAAFFYPPKMLERMRARDVSRPSDLKVRYYPRFYPYRNRLIHQPGWQSRADTMVRAWHRNS